MKRITHVRHTINKVNEMNLLKSFLYDVDQRMLRFSVFCAAIYFTQATGTTGGLAGSAINFFMKEGLKLNATTLSYIGFAITLAWYIKPLFGLLSDFVPIYGYRRKSYIYICNSTSVLLWLLLAGLAFSGSLVTFWPIAIVSGAMGFMFAITDVVADGLMVQTGKPTGDTGRFQSIQWGSINLGIILTTIAGSALALWAMPDTGESTFTITRSVYDRLAIIFLIASMFPFINILATYFLTEEKKIKLNKEKFNEIKSAMKRAIKMKSIWVLVICLFGLKFSPGWGTPFFYYIRDFCGLDGGQMGKMTFAYLGTFESAMGILGYIIYWKYAKVMNVRKLLYFAILFSFLTSFCYLWVQGVWSLVVFAILFGPIAAIVHMAYMDIMAKNCPDMAEGFVFAGVCSVSNIASSSSSAFGGWMYGKFGHWVEGVFQTGPWYEWGWSWTAWLTDFGVSPNMIALRPLIIISSLFTLATIVLIPFLKLNKNGIMKRLDMEE